MEECVRVGGGTLALLHGNLEKRDSIYSKKKSLCKI